MQLTIEVWRQENAEAEGRFVTYQVDDATPEMSLPELLDRLNDQLVEAGDEPIAFDTDCREGICGTCGITVNDVPHGKVPNTPTCRQHLRSYDDGDHLKLEPFRAASFPVVRDLVVDRTALDKVIASGGYVSVDAGTAPDADTRQIPFKVAETALDFSGCIGCGACIAACPNGAAHLFSGALLSHMSTLPQGKPERAKRARSVVATTEEEFGPCSVYAECVEVCPAGIPISAISAVNREAARTAIRRTKDD
ncbi:MULTISPECIES: succinate dehydrogenase/fumarate reductase iron-sulfur subunit [Kocuria]|uniref:succinate dehydrogenase n=1 Tax=Kocuria subflava TaxID=1736139 RepID=A0A846TT74_9MICC|nr:MULTISPECIES: succinate dehydrogenase/fumarate reductase iron-sulfur subunit [Kocuria]NKE08467.1 succinate dehydrogenase/fumarate reductase iron-sulfur subunit [Kocuria subflava]